MIVPVVLLILVYTNNVSVLHFPEVGMLYIICKAYMHNLFDFINC